MTVEIMKVFERSMKYFDKETIDLFKDYQSSFTFPGFRLIESVEASKAINLIKGSTIIMAGSGMVTGGRTKHHLIRNITRRVHAYLCGLPSGWYVEMPNLGQLFSSQNPRTVLFGTDED